MRKFFTFLFAALMSVSMFAEPTQQDLSLNYTDWEGAGGSISLTPESMLQCIVTEAPGGMELRWNEVADFSGWDKIVIEVHSMTNCNGNYYRLLGYLRDVSESATIQKRGEISTKLPGDEPAMITIDLRRKSALGDFDLTQVRVLGIQSQVAGSEFVIKRVYLEKSNIPFDPEGTLNFVELTAEMVSEWETDETIFSAADLPGFGSVTPEQAKTWSPTDTEVSSQLYYDFEESRAANYLNSFKAQTPNAGASVQQRQDIYRTIMTFGGKVYYTTGYTNSGEPEPQPTTYTLQLVADPAMGSVAVTNLIGSGIVDNGNGNYTVPENAEVTILATPLEGYEFSGWKEGNIEEMVGCYYCGTAINTNDNPYTFTMTADKAILAEFAAVTPAPAEDVDITPNADPDHAGVYYSTFYDSANKYALPAGVEAYVATLDGANLLLSKIADAGQTIPADNAVILKSSVTPFTLSISDAETVPVNAINHLEGTDVSIATPANCYVLAGNDGVGFYHYTASMLNPHKAYVIYSGAPNQAPKRMPFIFNQATGVENVQGDKVQSTKVIENGVLYIIKNGVKYNAQGQVVK